MMFCISEIGELLKVFESSTIDELRLLIGQNYLRRNLDT